MRSEDQIEKKVEKALLQQENEPSRRDSPYLRGVRDALGWVLEEEDDIAGLDDV